MRIRLCIPRLASSWRSSRDIGPRCVAREHSVGLSRRLEPRWVKDASGEDVFGHVRGETGPMRIQIVRNVVSEMNFKRNEFNSHGYSSIHSLVIFHFSRTLSRLRSLETDIYPDTYFQRLSSLNNFFIGKP